MSDDISEFDEAPVASESALAALLEQAEELVSLERQIKEVDDLLTTLTKRANLLKTSVIPDRMAEVGLSEFKTPAGDRVRVEDFVSGSLPKEPEARAAAIKRLEEWGAEDIIKNEIQVFFEKKQHNAAMAIADEIREQGFSCEVKSGVHPQTYLAFMRERLAEGEEVNAQEMGIFIGRKTKVALVKEKG